MLTGGAGNDHYWESEIGSPIYLTLYKAIKFANFKQFGAAFASANLDCDGVHLEISELTRS